MQLSTTDHLQGFTITDYLGIVVGQAVIGEDLKDLAKDFGRVAKVVEN
jgi:uncharacterized protein YbjQ (UPF0145 family)